MSNHANNNANNDAVLDWDSEIKDDGQSFALLPDGEYRFRVTGFDRVWYNGSSRMPPCNTAALTLEIITSEGETAYVKDRLFLARKSEWRISEFMRCIGQKKHGQSLRPKWDKVLGSEGRVRIGQRTYKTGSGEDRVVNEVRRYLDPEQGSVAPPAAQTWQAGKF